MAPETHPDTPPETRNDGFGLARTHRTLPIALLRAREVVMERFRPMLAANDVTEQQWRVMRVLEEAGETDASFLANKACILAPSLTRIMRTLEARGFIQAHRDEADGRRTLVELTNAGRAFLHELAPTSAAIYADIEAKVGQDKIEVLLDQIEDLLSALESH
ncbi:homoprotocatechuate degradation operon regulator HpaR [Celeribacter neptunius]|uniref:Homoprotocatechuate degradation operon regulator, HpaR n=1 Tax=Celeribacter neptunius TaxID=588602 RepID=A0A1I3UBE2_9RHOB|nr:homoprotocatechuate degradation operon regulator HpaR [Celeribacter neptunius]SFJ80232.1 homoprotocatechuate degradation operon regulator, HpaR [Celeribacter neptunius]